MATQEAWLRPVRNAHVVSMEASINLVKVFSVTKAKDRESIGERVTTWIAANPGVRIVNTVVRLSSDRAFHCFSIVLLCSAR